MVSVVIPMYNSENTIIRCINSVINQTYNGRIEIIIINDGSTDRSRLIVEDFINNNIFDKINIRLINKFNGGVSSARNAGLYEVKENYVALLDADDEWLPEKLYKQLDIFSNHNDVAFIGGLIEKPLNNKSIIRNITLHKLFFKNYFQPSTVIFKREILTSIGFFDESQNYAEEGNYFMRIAHKFRCVLLNEQVVNYGQGKGGFGVSGLSANLKDMEKGELKNLKYAYNERFLNFFLYSLAVVFSVLKYIRRILIVKLRKRC
jgi:glycosyltransferase involved in cell wall biosynthesis